jgi:hypothetical protein
MSPSRQEAGSGYRYLLPIDISPGFCPNSDSRLPALRFPLSGNGRQACQRREASIGQNVAWGQSESAFSCFSHNLSIVRSNNGKAFALDRKF